MRLDYRGNYTANWPELSKLVKAEAGHRCVRCHHPFTEDGRPLACDDRCDYLKGRIKTGLGDLIRYYNEADRRRGDGTITAAGAHAPLIPGLNYGVHHLDGDKDNNRWWNLLALCNSCHLHIQAVVIPERPWLFEHSEWFKPYACGFYAYWYGFGEDGAPLEITRREAEAVPAAFLKLGQPWLYESTAAHQRARPSVVALLHPEDASPHKDRP